MLANVNYGSVVAFYHALIVVAVCVRRGGLECVYRAMRNHRSAVYVQNQGCVALGNMSMNSANRARIASSGGLDVIYDAMTGHPTAVNLLEWACKVRSRRVERGGCKLVHICAVVTKRLFACQCCIVHEVYHRMCA